ncbi:hypothetical protein V6R21_32160 [Limibacter armeniacum]|uniref:hypothetical protein n=1 Tax=Limibacter armeniacum TaxID=466084 RepID=UPI002FE603C3
MTRITTLYVYFLLATCTLLSSCDTLDKLTQFELKYTSNVTIPATVPIASPFEIFTPEIKSDSESQMSINNTKKDLVEEIYLKSMTLTIKSPEGEDFSFLESLAVTISAEGLEEQQIAFKDNIGENVSDVIEMEVEKINLREYILKDEFKLKVTTVTDELNSKSYDIEIFTKYHVNAEILGI